MRGMKKSTIASGLLALVSHASAQVASVCRGDACFKLNIPQNTASSGTGDIFFQISAPSSYEWVALGLGSRMAGSNIFVVYTSGDGNNVTLSPRSTSNYNQPNFNANVQATLLEGSGVSGGKMIANVRCSNCNNGNGGSDFKATSGNWIYAYQSSGGPKNSDNTNVGISQHNQNEPFNWDYANAKGGESVNPLVNAAPSGSASGGASLTSCVTRGAAATSSGSAATTTATNGGDDDDDDHDDDKSTRYGRPTGPPSGFPTASPTGGGWGGPPKEKRQEITYCDEDPTSGFTSLGASDDQVRQKKMLIAHGTLGALAFVIFFPAGAIAIRLASFPGVVWFHAAFQVFAYLVYIAAFGLGVYLANEMELLDAYHPIIGIVVLVILFFQPIFGFLHHALFKKHGMRTFWSYAHIWLGRIAITLGIINGGLGLRLADSMNMSSKSGIIAYGVVAGIVWLVWVAASIIGERRRKTAQVDSPPKYTESPRVETAQRDIPHSADGHGHYAPTK